MLKVNKFLFFYRLGYLTFHLINFSLQLSPSFLDWFHHFTKKLIYQTYYVPQKQQIMIINSLKLNKQSKVSRIWLDWLVQMIIANNNIYLMQVQQQSSQKVIPQPQPAVEDEQIDEQIVTLSSNTKPNSNMQKLQQYQAEPNTKHCFFFNTRCEFFLFLLIAVLIFAAGYLIYDNRLQEGQISQILTILKKNQQYKQYPADNQHNQNLTKVAQNSKQNTNSLLTSDSDASQRQDLKDGKGSDVKVDLTTITKKVWYYNKEDLLQSKIWTQLTFQRIKKISQQNGYELQLVNEATWRDYLPKRKQRKLESMMQLINEDPHNKDLNSKQIDRIIKEITILQVLKENGGIYIDEDIVLTENLDWVNNIHTNQLVNAWQLIFDKQNNNRSPKFIGFYTPELSNDMQKYSRIKSNEETQQYIVKLPSINFYFMASTPYSSFIEDVLDDYYTIALNYTSLPNMLKKMKIEIDFNRNGGNQADFLFQIAVQSALRKKQLSLQADQIAIEHYCIASINQNYGPTKLKSYLGQTQIDKIFNHLSLITEEELEYQFGKIRYLSALTPIDKIYIQFQRIHQSKAVIQNSFIHRYLLNAQKVDGIIVVKAEQLSQKKWDELPNKMWLFEQANSQSNSFFTQIWIKHLKQVANQSAFDLNIVTNQNLHQYLPKETIASINQAMLTNKLNIYESTKRQLISLAILHQHGGIWVQSYVMFMEGLDWLRDIGKQRFIWNKFGQVPKVVVAFHPHFGSPFHWNYDPNTGTKEAWHLAYEHSLIAALPKSDLINDWFTQLLTNLQLDYNDVVKKFESCKINDHKWINDRNQQLLSQDSIKCALGTKTLELIQKGQKKSSPQHYGLWGLNGFASLLKMRQYTNFISGRSMQNPLIWRYSLDQMQDQIGKISHFTKVYDATIAKIEEIYSDNMEFPLRQFNSKSFFMHLINQSSDKVTKKDGKLFLSSSLLDYQKTRSQMLEEMKSSQSLTNIPHSLWIYQSGELDPNDFFSSLAIKNINHYAKESSFDVRQVTDQNYKAWFNPNSESYKKLNNFLINLESKLKNQKSNLGDHYHQIKGEAILLTLLYQFGGIYISKSIILHQNLNWIKNVETLQFVNKGGNSTAQVFGIFSPGYSIKQNNKIGDNTVQYPSLQNFFLASGKKTQFLHDFIEEYMNVIENNSKAKEKLQSLKQQFLWLHGQDPYYQCFFLASQFTLFKRKLALQAQNSKLSVLDYYGLYSINTHFYPYKLHKYYSSFRVPTNNIIKSLGETHLTDLEEEIGKFRFFSIISKQEEIAAYIKDAITGREDHSIVQSSFLHKFLLFQVAKGLVKKQMAYSQTANGSSWSNLPKSAWVYIPEGLKSSTFGAKIVFLALKEALAKANFELKQVSNSNIEHYIDKFNLKKINRLLNKENEQHKSLIYRLAILAKHGGIALAPQILFTEDLKWIRSIADLDRKMLFNRYGEIPKILLMVDTLQSPANKWNYNPEQQSKTGHNIGWSDTFIAVEKENELIKEWYEELTTYLELDPKELSEVFDQCKVNKIQWSTVDSSKLGSDALLCVLNRKKHELLEDDNHMEVCDYYKLWGISQSLGMNKMEAGLNLDQITAEPNPFLWRWQRQQVETLIGNIRPMVKLTRKQIIKLEEVIATYKLNSWGEENSLLSKNLYEPLKSKLKELDGRVVIHQ